MEKQSTLWSKTLLEQIRFKSGMKEKIHTIVHQFTVYIEQKMTQLINVPDPVDILDCKCDFSAKFLFVVLHL